MDWSEPAHAVRAGTRSGFWIRDGNSFINIGKALPGRRNLVISRQPDYRAEGCQVFASPAAALAAAADADEVMIIGGGRIYRQLLPQTDRIYLTRVHATPEGDTFFPTLDPSDWRVTEIEEFPAGDGRPLGYSFETLDRAVRQL